MCPYVMWFQHYRLLKLHYKITSFFSPNGVLPPPLLSASNFKPDVSLISNEVRQKAALSGWAKKYVVVEIPPYCRQRGGSDDGEVARRTEGNKDDLSGESWSSVTRHETDSGEAMDCCSSQEEEEERGRGTDTSPMWNAQKKKKGRSSGGVDSDSWLCEHGSRRRLVKQSLKRERKHFFVLPFKWMYHMMNK